jgi:hypothetical protein
MTKPTARDVAQQCADIAQRALDNEARGQQGDMFEEAPDARKQLFVGGERHGADPGQDDAETPDPSGDTEDAKIPADPLEHDPFCEPEPVTPSDPPDPGDPEDPTCPSGWHLCGHIEAPWGVIKNPDDAIGLFRLEPGGEYPVCRAYDARGRPVGLDDGRSLWVNAADVAGGAAALYAPSRRGHLLLNEPAAAYLRGELPVEPVPTHPGSAAAAHGIETEPYSGVTRVLVAQECKGLFAAHCWADRIATFKRHGGLPVIGVVAGDIAILERIKWPQPHPRSFCVLDPGLKERVEEVLWGYEVEVLS